MPNKVKHLRGTDEEWAANDVVIDDGEIALSKGNTGRYRIKIGNGVSKFSELEMLGGEVIEPTGKSVRLGHCHDIRFGELPKLTLYFPSAYEKDFYCVLTFDSGTTPTTMAYVKSNVLFSGRSVVGGELVPEANVHYTAVFWYDGKLQCHVRGIENA